MISGYVRNGDAFESLRLLCRMFVEHGLPDLVCVLGMHYLLFLCIISSMLLFILVSIKQMHKFYNEMRTTFKQMFEKGPDSSSKGSANKDSANKDSAMSTD